MKETKGREVESGEKKRARNVGDITFKRLARKLSLSGEGDEGKIFVTKETLGTTLIYESSSGATIFDALEPTFVNVIRKVLTNGKDGVFFPSFCSKKLIFIGGQLPLVPTK